MSDPDPRWNEAYDFIVMGSGVGGVASAITAHDQGLRVLLVEKAPTLGGVTAWSAGQLWVPDNHLRHDAGIPDSDEEARRYLEFLSAGWAEPRLQEVFLARAAEALEYFGRVGMPWAICRRQPDYHFPEAPGSVAEGRYIEVTPVDGSSLGVWRDRTSPSPYMPSGITTEEMYDWGGPVNRDRWDLELLQSRRDADQRTFGHGLMAALLRLALVDRSVTAWTSSPVRRLVQEDGVVTGAEIDRAGETVLVRAHRGVLIAAGGYDHAPKELARSYEQRPDWQSRAPVGVTGDNLVFGGEIGASIAVLPPTKAAILGYRIPGASVVDGSPKWNASFEGGFPHALIVNAEGRRFGDESFYRDYQPATQVFLGSEGRFANLPAFMIFDQSFRDRFAVGEIAPGEPLPDGFVTEANSLDELATQLGVDGDGLEATVARFNEFAASGVDRDFGRGTRPWALRVIGDSGHRPNPCLAPLDRPPYYGLPLCTVSSGINVAGLRFDENARVLHVRGHAIPGLYVAGNSSAHLDIGAGYNSGIANTRGLLWGYIAALHAAGSAPG